MAQIKAIVIFFLRNILGRERVLFWLMNEDERTIMSFREDSYLRTSGWLNSGIHQMPINRNGEPIPWMTLPFVSFISERLATNLTVFEYGSGNSTFFFSKKVSKVVAVEHNQSWYEEMKRKSKDNINMVFQEFGGEGDGYSQAILHQQTTFDIIVVDGVDRSNCCKVATKKLSARGVIVVDDSDRSDCQAGNRYLLENNFKRLNFWGIAPGLFYEKCTTLFYKADNCIGL